MWSIGLPLRSNVGLPGTLVAGERSPWLRITGEKQENWHQRTYSSRKSGSFGSPPANPPMSVVNHGMPAMPICTWQVICALRSSNVECTSPDQTSEP